MIIYIGNNYLLDLRRGISGQLQLIVTGSGSNQCVVINLVAAAPHEVELGLSTYTHMCVHIYTHVCTHIHTRVCIYIYMYVHKYVHTCTYTNVCTHTYAYACVHVCTYTRTYAYVCMCVIHIYIYLHRAAATLAPLWWHGTTCRKTPYVRKTYRLGLFC
jgi:hypothetical protein